MLTASLAYSASPIPSLQMEVREFNKKYKFDEGNRYSGKLIDTNASEIIIEDENVYKVRLEDISRIQFKKSAKNLLCIDNKATLLFYEFTLKDGTKITTPNFYTPSFYELKEKFPDGVRCAGDPINFTIETYSEKSNLLMKTEETFISYLIYEDLRDIDDLIYWMTISKE